ncbi:fungal-specific transcription factor domain-containing protein [Lasiosphaeria miniovina]|uniref:Fungal-specific transcription factor domain-containing protein n=1 Tax=Lasiosphaeria miniovina TaxID=1954250 RepID=A0AA40DK01_9PEZI|nr:fungal-specific transcription factor domain-containing protein [Lasiosphaeria miniovina]KAK0705980.1 fungal-specific transcription factor domain-containing protein [Lasiosphaeria miniovina]
MTMALGSIVPAKGIEHKKSHKFPAAWTLHNGDNFFSSALNLTDSDPAEPSLESVQARLLQSLYFLSTCRFTQARYTFSSTVQMIFAIGLHRRLGRNRGLGSNVFFRPDYASIQCQRRTFWSAVVLDRQLSMFFGRPGHFTADTIDQDLPDCVNDEDMGNEGPIRPSQGDCYIDGLVSFTKIRSEVYALRDIPETVRFDVATELAKELDDWKVHVPGILNTYKPSMLHTIFRRQATLLGLAHCHAQILLRRPFLTAPYPKDDKAQKIRDPQIRTCIVACRDSLQQIIGLARDLDSV